MSTENVVISMDSHTDAFVDLKPWMPKKYHQAFDAAIDVGRRTFESACGYFAHLAYQGWGTNMTFESAKKMFEVDVEKYNQKLTIEERIRNIDADGVAAECFMDGFGAISLDPALQHETTLAYSRWFKDYVSVAPHRFRSSVVTSLCCEIEMIVDEIHDAHEHGITAIHLPPTPHAVSPNLPLYNHRRYEPIWAALNERGMSAVFHSSVGREKPLWLHQGTERGWEALSQVTNATAHHATIYYLLLAGVPARYPNMHFGYVESGSKWVRPMLDQIQHYTNQWTKDPTHKLELSPLEQWRRQGFCSGPLDASEIANRHAIGVGNLMFGSDYIHTEGTYPHTREHLRNIFRGVPADERFAIVAGNAAKLMGFDLDRLATTAAAQTCWFAVEGQSTAA